MHKISLVFFPVGAAAALCLWFFNNSTAPFGSFFADRAGLVMALGRLAGILAALGVMGQLLVMSRAAWLEPLTGPGLPVKWHHRAGLATALILLAHPALVVWYHAGQTGNGFLSQYLSVLRWDDVLAAACGEFFIISAVFLSLPFARRRLSAVLWHRVHLGTYLGLALAVGHQLELGMDLSAGLPYFSRVWYALLIFTAANAVWYRLLKPVFRQNA